MPWKLPTPRAHVTSTFKDSQVYLGVQVEAGGSRDEERNVQPTTMPVFRHPPIGCYLLSGSAQIAVPVTRPVPIKTLSRRLRHGRVSQKKLCSQPTLSERKPKCPPDVSRLLDSCSLSLGLAAQLSADEIIGDAVNSVARDTKRRNCWPEPWLGPDRAVTRAPFCIMVANGWRRQNMLGEFHFEPGSGQLTEAGRLKVQWILTACPEQHRLVYVPHDRAGERDFGPHCGSAAIRRPDHAQRAAAGPAHLHSRRRLARGSGRSDRAEVPVEYAPPRLPAATGGGPVAAAVPAEQIRRSAAADSIFPESK